MVVLPIQHATADYHAECALRHEVLRVPLGLDLYAENLAAESDQLHFGLFVETDGLVACVIAVPEAPGQARFRQMAVRPAHQGRGFGRTLLAAVEADLRARGFFRFHLHARLTAAGFYATLGYTPDGPGFTEVGLPHVRMIKTIGSAPVRS